MIIIIIYNIYYTIQEKYVKYKYNYYMDIKTQLKILLTLKHISMEELAKRMSKETNKLYTPAKIYGKLNRDTISFTECQHIAKILGYKIEFKEV